MTSSITVCICWANYENESCFIQIVILTERVSRWRGCVIEVLIDAGADISILFSTANCGLLRACFWRSDGEWLEVKTSWHRSEGWRWEGEAKATRSESRMREERGEESNWAQNEERSRLSGVNKRRLIFLESSGGRAASSQTLPRSHLVRSQRLAMIPD